MVVDFEQRRTLTIVRTHGEWANANICTLEEALPKLIENIFEDQVRNMFNANECYIVYKLV